MVLTSLSMRRVENTGEVAVRDHGDQRGFGAFAALEEPIGEVRTGAVLGDGDVDRAHASIEVAVAIPVALDGPVGARSAVFRAGDRVGVRGEELVDDPLQHRAHQIRGGFGKGFAEQAVRVDNMRSGHRDDSVRECCERFTRRITR